MSSNFQKKSSNIFLTLFIGLIIISFMFTGYQSMQGAPDAVATVGDQEVKVGEFQNAYQRQLEFYKNMMGGKDLSSKQIEQFGIKNNVLNQLISAKLQVQLGEDLGIVASPKQVKKEIKELPYFKTNEKFDINRYKQLLSYNKISPTQFESDFKSNVVAKNTQAIFSSMPVSKGYAKSIEKFKKNAYTTWSVSIDRNTIKNNLKVSNSEVKKYLKEQINLDRVKAVFKDRKSTLDRPAQVKARHILFKIDSKDPNKTLAKVQDIRKKLSSKNFAKMAKRHSEGPSKKDGGSLGWFSKGRMVKEFEAAAFSLKKGYISAPVKTQFGYHLILVEDKKNAVIASFESHKNDLAKEQIRNTKTSEIDEKIAQITSEVKKALSSKKKSTIKRLAKKYELEFDEKFSINQYDGPSAATKFDEKVISEIFNDANPAGKVYESKTATATNLILVESKTVDDTSNLDATVKSLQAAHSQQVSSQLIADLRESLKVKVNTKILR